jgi:Bacterial Ig domain
VASEKPTVDVFWDRIKPRRLARRTDTANSANDAAVTIDVIANDTDSDGTIDPTSVQIASQPGHGVVSATATGSVVYTPTAGYSGSDSFTYTVKDDQGAVSNAATVTLTMTAAAPPPRTGGSSGGGSATLLDLLALGGLLAVSRGSRRRSANARLTHQRIDAIG